MAATILLRNVGGIEDKRVAMTNAQIARLLSYGTAWTKLRIGIRWSMTDTGASITGTPRFAMGLCAGVTNIMGDATVDHFVGIISNPATWSYSTGTPNMYRYISSGWFAACKKVGSSLTIGSNMNQYGQVMANTGYRTLRLLEITKGSPNFTLSDFSCQGTADVSLDTFLAKMEEAVPALTNYAWSTPVTLAVDEATNGYLNAVNLYWDRTAPVVEISDLAVARLA